MYTFITFLILHIVSIQTVFAAECSTYDLSVVQNRQSSRGYQSEDLTQWIEPKSKKPKAVVIVAHGMNFKPSRMKFVNSILLNQNLLVLQMSFTGHSGQLEETKYISRKEWLNDAEEVYCLASKEATKRNSPLYLATFSFSSVLFSDFFTSQSHMFNQVSKIVQFAPGFTPHFFTRIVEWLRFLPNIMIPSMNLPEFRAQNSFPLDGMNSFFESLRKVEKVKNKLSSLAPSIVFIHPNDELIDENRLSDFFKESGLDSKWKTITLGPLTDAASKGFAHMVVEPQMVGPNNWKIIESAMRDFL